MTKTEIPRLQTPHIVTHSECGKYCDNCNYLYDVNRHGDFEELECVLYGARLDLIEDRSIDFPSIRLPQCINKEPA